MLGRRVAVTGLGVVSTCGIGREAFWSGLHGPGLTGRQWITIEDWDPNPYFANPKEARRADRVEQFAVAAAAEAFEQAGDIGVDPSRFGVILGTGIGGLGTLEEQVQIRLEKGERRVSPFLVPMMMANASGAAISMRYGLQGPNETICTACAAATHALGYAARLIAMGRCDAIVSGGSEAAATPSSLAGFSNMTALSTSGSSRPFDKNRDGFVIAGGAGVLVLEEYERARARGAKIYAELAGYGATSDGHDMVAPSGEGAERCMRMALANLKTPIDYVNPHATSTPVGDAKEIEALRNVFGAGAKCPPISATKSLTGHSLGAAGVQEAIYSLLMMQHGFIAESANIEELDPDFADMNIVRERRDGAALRAVLSNSFGFGGTNASLVFKHVDA